VTDAAASTPHRVGLANQLRAQLQFFHPGPAGLFADLDAVTSMQFLTRFTSQGRHRLAHPVPARDLAARRRIYRPQGPRPAAPTSRLPRQVRPARTAPQRR
jgi:hypothetical protein